MSFSSWLRKLKPHEHAYRELRRAKGDLTGSRAGDAVLVLYRCECSVSRAVILTSSGKQEVDPDWAEAVMR